MSSKKLICILMLLFVGVASQAFAQTATVVPSQVPKGAYVNGPGGDTDDNQYYQQLRIVMAGDHADGTITITPPTGLTVGDYDDDTNFNDEISVIYTTVDAAATVAVNAATTANSIVLTLTQGGGFAAADDMYITFPVESELNPTVTSEGYAIAFSDNTNNTDFDTTTGPQITYYDPDSLSVATFAALLTAGDDSTANFGEYYPDTTNDVLFNAVLPDFVIDGGDAQVNSNMTTALGALDGANADEIVYTLWVSTDSTLGHVSEVESGVLHAIDFDNGGNYVLNEGDQGNQVAETKGRIAASGLSEGDYFVYITSNYTGDFPLARSGRLTVLHYPVVKIMGWDQDQSGTFDNEAAGGYDDDASLTLDTGSYVDIDGVQAGAGGTATSSNLFISVDDFDDNAQVVLFYSTDSGLTLSDLVVSGPDSARVIDELTGATTLVDTLYENQEDLDGFIGWDWSVLPTSGDYIPANSYTLYAAANDGKHQHLLKAGGAQNIAGLTIDVRHSPYLKLNSLAEYDADGVAPFIMQLENDDVIMISWGKQGITGDADIDNSCLISLYIDEDTGADDAPDHVSTDASGLQTNGQLIVANLEEDLESKTSSFYTWDIKAFADSTGWIPTAGTDYHLYAIIDENITGGVQRVVVLNTVNDGGGDDLDDLVEGTDEPDAIQFNNAGFVRLLDPPADGVTVYGDDTYRMRFEAFDLDEDAYVGIFVVKKSNANFATGPVTTTVAALTAEAAGEAYCLTTAAGDVGAGVAQFPVEGTDTYYDLTVRLPSEADLRYADSLNGGAGADVDLAEGEYWVYVGLDYDAVAANVFDAAQTLYRAPGTITFRNIADTDDPSQQNLMMLPDVITVAEGDTVLFSVNGADEDAGNTFVDLIDLYIAVEKDYFDIVNTSAPFTDNVPGTGTLLANRVIDDAANNRWILNASAYNGSNPIALADADLGTGFATFQLVAKGTENAIDAESAVYFVNEPSRGWKTMFSNNDSEVSIVIGSQRTVELPRGIIEGIVEFQGRNTSDMIVTFDLRPRGSYVNYYDSSFYTRNDGSIYGTTATLDSATTASDGIQYQLDNDGHFELYQVPPGEWDLVVTYNRYLAKKSDVSVYAGLDTLFVSFGQLLGGDAIGYTDSSGVVMPNNRIDSDDISQISNAFLATAATDSANWYAPNNWRWADIDEDGEVNIEDLKMATGNYTGADVDGAQPVYAKPMIEPVSNIDASVSFLNLPTELVAGQDYTVQVKVENTFDVAAFFVNLDYDNDALAISSITNGDFISYSYGYAFPVIRDENIGFASSFYGSKTADGDGVLASFTFTALESGAFANDMLSFIEMSFVNSSIVKESLDLDAPTVVEEAPAAFAIAQNFPNPFNPTTTISFSIPANDHVKVTIYDILGRQVRSLVDARYSAGSHSVVWDARDNTGAQVSTGVYFYRVEAGAFHATNRMMFMK